MTLPMDRAMNRLNLMINRLSSDGEMSRTDVARVNVFAARQNIPPHEVAEALRVFGFSPEDLGFSATPLEAGGVSVAAPTPAEPSEQEIRYVQATLRDFGYDLNPDGVMGEETARALRSFQHRQLLPETGVIDEATASALRDMVSETQRALSAAGFPTNADGSWGDGSRRAMRAFIGEPELWPMYAGVERFEINPAVADALVGESGAYAYPRLRLHSGN